MNRDDIISMALKAGILVATSLAVIVMVLLVTAGVVVLFTDLFPNSFVRKEHPTDARFRAACMQVNGNAVWNGRHWECLK
jgi:hypothetical protein